MNSALEKAILDSLADFKSKIGGDFWIEFTDTPENELNDYHFSIGQHLRDEVLVPESNLLKLFYEEGIKDKNTMSDCMLKIWHKSLNE